MTDLTDTMSEPVEVSDFIAACEAMAAMPEGVEGDPLDSPPVRLHPEGGVIFPCENPA